MVVAFLVCNLYITNKTFWWFSGSEERRHHFYGSIPVHRKWNYFCLAGGKAATKASLLGELSHTRLTGKVFNLMTRQVVNSTWLFLFFIFGTFPWLANFESSDLAIWAPYVKICVKSTSKKSDQFIKLGWWLIVSNPNEPFIFLLLYKWALNFYNAGSWGEGAGCKLCSKELCYPVWIFVHFTRLSNSYWFAYLVWCRQRCKFCVLKIGFYLTSAFSIHL